MKCSKIKLISPYIDGELGKVEQESFETHLPVCPECSRRLEGFRLMREGFSRAEKHRAPYGFSTREIGRAHV